MRGKCVLGVKSQRIEDMTTEKNRTNGFVDWELISKSFRGGLSEEEERELRRWLEESPAHARFYEEARKGGETDAAEGLPPRVLQAKHEELLGRLRAGKRAARFRRIVRLTGYAAAVALPAAVALWLLTGKGDGARAERETPSLARTESIQLRLSNGQYIDLSTRTDSVLDVEQGTKIHQSGGALTYRQDTVKEREAVRYNELSVPTGQECRVVLDDGSTLWVNSNTRVKYPVAFARDKRSISVKGEVYLEVVKDGRPFIVQTEAGSVRVLGTSFGVRAYDEEVLTTLVSGRVRFTNKAGSHVELKASEQAVARAEGKVEKRTVRVEEFVGWKDGWYIFREERLEDVMETLAKWYGVEVFFQSQRARDIRFTGNLKRSNTIEAFLEALEASEDVSCQINGNTVILH